MGKYLDLDKCRRQVRSTSTIPCSVPLLDFIANVMCWQLLDEGFVAKSNFDMNDPDSDFNADKYFDQRVRATHRAPNLFIIRTLTLPCLGCVIVHHPQRNNPVLTKARQATAERTEQAEKAFNEWMQNKAMCEQAARYLDAIDSPASLPDPQKGEEHWLVSLAPP
jgi:hypothetical protein